MKPRKSLFSKYLLIFLALAAGLLLAGGALGLYFSYQENRTALADLQREKAEAAAGRIEQQLYDIVHHVGLTAPLKPGDDALVQRKQEIKLLRQMPAISDIILLDRYGKEQLRISRLGADVAGSDIDYSHTAAFQEAKFGRPYFSTIYFRRNTEPYITIATVVGPEEAGITVVEVNLQFLLEGINRIAPGNSGMAYAVDAHGQLIAHQDLALVLKKTDMSALPQVRAAMTAPPGSTAQALDGADLEGRPVLAAYGLIVPLGWRVFVEQPLAEALAPWRASAMRFGLLLLVQLLLALLAGAFLVRRLVQPIRSLQQDAARIGDEPLSRRIELHTGDELEQLADQFNRIAQRMLECSADAERRISERNAEALQAQRAAERAYKRLIGMTEALPLAVFQFRETHAGTRSFAFVSQNVREVLGVSAADIMADQAARWRTALPEDRDAIMLQLKCAIAARQSADFHHRIRIDGELRWIHAYAAAPRMIDGDWVWSGFWMDETEAHERLDELRAAKEQADATALDRAALLANMSHEILPPMNTIIGLSHLALKTELAPPQLDYVSKIHHAGGTLLGIINDILDFARIEAGKLVIENSRFTLSQVIENLASTMGRQAQTKGLELDFDLPGALPRTVIGDPVRLEQILSNLVGNAVKFTEKGKVTVRTERVYSTGQQILLRFSVRDTGIGMTPEQCDRMFNTVTQIDSSTLRKYGGIGLGLIVSKRLIELMGGTIEAESAPGNGSTFSFTVKLGLVRNNMRQGPPGELEGLRVLLVEDNEINQQIAMELMESEGVVVELADNGRIALDKLSLGGRYDIVLMDLQMPEMDGYAATSAIRAIPALAGLPVVALTAHTTAEERERCLATGMNDHVAKPIDPVLLFDALKRWDRRPQQDKPAAGERRQMPENIYGKMTAPQDGRSAYRRMSNETFQQLVGYLSSGDADALDCFAEHRLEVLAALGQHQAALVERAISDSDFATALTLLDTAMTRLDIGFER